MRGGPSEAVLTVGRPWPLVAETFGKCRGLVRPAGQAGGRAGVRTGQTPYRAVAVLMTKPRSPALRPGSMEQSGSGSCCLHRRTCTSPTTSPGRSLGRAFAAH